MWSVVKHNLCKANKEHFLFEVGPIYKGFEFPNLNIDSGTMGSDIQEPVVKQAISRTWISKHGINILSKIQYTIDNYDNHTDMLMIKICIP